MTELDAAEQQLSSILSSEVEGVQGLLNLLEEEYELLQQPDPQPLEEVTQRKQQQIEKLSTAMARQNSFLRDQDLPLNRQGIETFLEQCAPDSPLHEQWSELERQLASSQKQNEVNGVILTQSRQQISNALNLLQGLPRGQSTYGPSGEARTDPSNKLLGSA